MNQCFKCSKETTNPKFCSRSCNVSTSNQGVRRHGKAPASCIVCENKCKNSIAKFCSHKCNQDFKLQERINSGTFSAQTGKRWLLKTQGHQCSCCKNTSWNNQPIPIELEHIDGNSSNNDLENLCLLCPNCHAQTPTYKSKNKGNGRAYRRQRYAEGKSY
jgi:hypothetical protein